MLKELFQIFGIVSIDNKNANKALDETSQKGKTTADSLSRTFETAGKVLTTAGKFAMSAGKVITVATGGIVAGLSSAINRFDTLTNYPKVLSNLGFSAEDAKRSIDTLTDGIDGLPTALDDAASGVQRLVAKNNDIDKSTKYFLAMNNAIIAGNAPMEQQKTALEQLTQAYSKGKPDLMEWRTLTMAMPGQLKQIANAMGYVNSDALYEAFKKGTLSMDKFMNAIVELNENGAEGIMSFQEQAHNSCDSIGTAVTNVANRVKKGFATILGSMNEVAKDTSLGSIASGINKFSKGVKDLLDKIGGAVKENQAFKTFIEQIAKSLEKFENSINNLSSEQLDKIVTTIVNLVKAGPMLLATGKGLNILGSGFSGLGKAFKILDTANNSIFGFVSKVDKMPGKIKGGLANTLSSITSFGNKATNTLSNMFSGGVFDKIRGGLGKITSTVASFGGKLFSPFKLAFDKIVGGSAIFTQLLKFNISERLSPIFSKITGTLNNAFPNISSGLSKITGAFGGAFKGILGKVGSFASSFLPMFTKIFGFAGVIGAVVAGLGLLSNHFGVEIDNILNTITEKGPSIITNLANSIMSKLPELMNEGGQLVQHLIETITANMPAILSAGANIVSELVMGISEQLPDLLPMAIDLIMTIVNSLIENLPLLVEAGLQLLMGLVQGLVNAIPTLISWLPTIITTICNAITTMLPQIIQAGITILVSLIQGLVNAIPQLVQMLPQIINTIITVIVENLPVIIDAGIQILIALIDGLIQAIPMLIEMLPQIITTIITVIAQNLPRIIEAGGKIITSLVAGIGALIGKVGEAAVKIGESIWNVLRELPGKALQWGKDLIQGMIDGIKSMFGAIGNAVKGVGDKIKSFLHFSRPDEGPLREYEQWMPDMIKGLTETLTKSAPTLYKATKSLAQKVSEGLDFTKIPDQINTTAVGNVIWNSNGIDTPLTAYTISRNSNNSETGPSIGDSNLGVPTLVKILEYYLPLILRACGKEIVFDKGKFVKDIIPIIDEELAL